MNWTKLTDLLPDPEEHDRVLIYTEDFDFAGAQYFDVRAVDLNECSFEYELDQPEECRCASHWSPRPF